MSFSIITDTSANLPTALLREHDIAAIPFRYYIKGREFTCTDTEAFDAKSFYGSIREGMKVTTSLVSPAVYADCFRVPLQRGEDLVFVGMSSGISGSFGSAQLAAGQLREEFPERSIFLVDSIGASLGEGLLALRAAELRAMGRTARETAGALQRLREKMCQVFTVDDLMHLRSTGRLSNAAAVIATVLNIKPLLKGNENGQIVAFARVRGRRRSIEAIADNYDRLVEDAGRQTVGIAHADCLDDAEYLASLLRRNHPPRDVMIVDYEPVTGSHVGPGALALFFFGSDAFRSENYKESINRDKGALQ